MRSFIFAAVAVLVLAGCGTKEREAQRALVAAQGIENEGRLIAALDAFEAVAGRWPDTDAGREAAKVAQPLRAQRNMAEIACAQFERDTGQAPRDTSDFLRQPPGLTGWSGPYVRNADLGHFGRWVAATECGLLSEKWPANDQPVSDVWAKRDG